jgi:F-type H+-transporting ATPase subunit delta
MNSTKAASRYAKALLELAIEQGNLDKVAADMAYMHKVCTEEKDFVILLNSPIIKSDKKISIFQSIFGDFDRLSSMFIELIAKNRREYMLGEIASSFGAQLKAHKGIVPVTLISAKSLNAKTKDVIMEKISASVKGKLEVTEVIDESLIGGFVVRMDDKQIDASISTQFKNLKQRLTR